MFAGIAAFEFRYQLKNPVFWVSTAIFFLLGFGATASANVGIGTPGAVHENSPYAVTVLTAICGLFYLFALTAFVANAIIRDDSTGYAPIIHSAPITKTSLLAGRFTGGFLVSALGFLALPLGMAFGVLMPWVDPETVGPASFATYLWPFLVIAVPNIFLSAALLFALATITRSMLASYIGVVIFVMGYLVVTSLFRQVPEYQSMMARFEPLGIAAITETTQYWTTADMNSRLIPLTGELLFNRIVMIAIGFGLLALTWWRFSLAERAPSKRRLRKLARQEQKAAKIAAVPPATGGENVAPSYGWQTTRAQFAMRLKTEIMQVLKSPGLIVLALLAVINSAFAVWTNETTYGTPTYPMSAMVIETLTMMSSVYLLIVAVFYGGELVWRERDRNVGEIIDSAPVSNWVIFIPKIAAMLTVLLILHIAIALTGIVYQLASGGSVNLGDYLIWFIVPSMLQLFLISILALFVQVISPNKYVGWGLMLIWFVGGIFIGNLGYTNNLYNYAATPEAPLSDMNGKGGFAVGEYWALFYWLCFGAILLVVAHLVWPRGGASSVRERFRNIRKRLAPAPLAIGGVALVAMIGSGLFIHHNIKELNVYRTSDEMEKIQADYERKYLKYETLPRPVVTDVTYDVQLFPKERRMEVTGHYMLRNNLTIPIKEVHVRQGDYDIKYPLLKLAGAKQSYRDGALGYHIFTFDQPLLPGQTARLDFKSQIWRRGFKNGLPDTDVIQNGSFVNNFTFAPIIGMDRSGLLSDRTQRRRQGLPAELRPAKLEDVAALQRNYINADWVNSDITLTTDADQTPIAPGKKVSDTSANGRRVAHFKSTAPILNFFSIQSARYAVDERQHAGITTSIYYHPSHQWNVPIMQKALATSLDYYQQNFGPYQFDYARIIEFPGYSSFAQAFAGTMPYSESIGFAANVSNPDDIDYVTFVTAHELAHQYWAHQAVGADMQGSTLTTETLAEYSALMVMKKLYGKDKIRRFLKYDLDRYLGGRQGEALEELPLVRVENQPYVHYSKGAMVMYLLQERLGEDAVNRALRRYVERYRFKGAPYPRSIDVIEEFRKEAKTPEQLALIRDLFERITLYDLKVTAAKAEQLPDGKWRTTMTVNAQKLDADGKGKERNVPLNEQIEIGLFKERPGLASFDKADVLFMERRPVRSGAQQIVVISGSRPAFAGVDPYNFYVDRDSDDNVLALD